MQKIILNTLIEISSDGLKAYMTLLDNQKIEENSQDYVSRIIEEIKDFIKIGLDIKKVKRVLYDGIVDVKTQIAEGIMPIDGKDGCIKYNFDINKKRTPKVLEDGSVDYKELDIINNVTEGEILAEVVPPIEGKPGMKVTGEIIPYKKGTYPNIKYGKNVRFLEDKNILIAEKNGLVTLIDNKLVVLDIYKVENVDNTVGNIHFDGTVIVRGNVLNEFKVNADGDVQINGIIEGGYVENTGDLVVKQGIQGYNKLVVRSLGNVTSKFIENAIVVSEKNVSAEVILHSQISCKGSVNMYGKRGLIIGGVIRAGREISAKTVGSIMHTITTLEVGVEPKIKDKYENIRNEIDKKNDELNKILKTSILLERLKKANKLDNTKIELYKKVEKTKAVLMEELERLNNEYKLLDAQIMNASNGIVRISKTVYPGVKIIIGNNSITIREERKGCTFYVDGGEIKIGSYWEW